MSQHAQPLRHQTEGLITKRGEPHVRQIWMLLRTTADEVWVKWPFKASAAYSEEASHQSSWRSNSSTSQHFSAGHWRARGGGITHQSLRHWWWRRPPCPQICDWKDRTTKDWLTCAVLVNAISKHKCVTWQNWKESCCFLQHMCRSPNFIHAQTHTLCLCKKYTEQTLSLSCSHILRPTFWGIITFHADTRMDVISVNSGEANKPREEERNRDTAPINKYPKATAMATHTYW